MKNVLLITILLISNICFSQLKSVIIDSKTKEKIPYVNIWVENENIGTTSNEKGEFELEVNKTKIILFSAIGFETKRISSDSIKNILELKPVITELDEIVIKSKNSTNKLIIGKFKKSKIDFYFSCGTKPWITARYFKYKEEYEKTIFINKIKVLTKSKVKDSKFNIRLYNINNEGEPEGYIYDENIIATAKKGKKNTEIDITELNIEFPKKGFFIAIEWLIIEDNKYEYKYTITGSKKKHDGISYEPYIGTIPAESDENSWIFTKGKWRKIWKNKSPSKKYKEKYNLMAIELTLSN
ncbi:carboxypeptidase-like regulatory domain-containing protein [Bizionia gelidisalsuginis]|uniref:Carboxypeptidase-like regulatory domain-containing protein n=1 Tax=Bizionia gelidisalsuginis TaxID=291188 RepID=A0ABY3M6R7_9FLAO|nr:carboxypeptidase-like regulatory domain-containing protein [Bizionia gelidisalsuginis]TYC07439.1 carboxypeptidase-like regulatory domain-containing protein [Bizionia gelidisalsuginis]